MADFTTMDFITCLMLAGIAAAGIGYTRSQVKGGLPYRCGR